MKKYYLILYLCISSYTSFSQIYVKQDAIGTNDGTSWNNAYTNLQTAINTATVNDEIWVASGTYKPIESPDSSVQSDQRSWCFYINKDIKLYGGFSGIETSLSERNFTTNPTILSGEIGNQANFSDNSHHVVIITNTTKEALLDGFTVTRGHAKGGVTISFDGRTFFSGQGGGVYITNAFTTLKNLIIDENKANRGGGIYYLNAEETVFSERVIIENVTFSFNEAISVNAGGGLLLSNCNPLIYNAIFEENRAELFSGVGGTGGGVVITNSSRVFFYNPVFYANYAFNQGSAIVADNSEITVYNGTFVNQNKIPLDLENYLNSDNHVRASVFYNNGTFGDVSGDLDLSSATNTYNASSSQAPYDEVDDASAHFTDLSSATAADVFINIDNPKGPDNIWRTVDDGLMPNNTSPLLEAAGVSSGPYSQDVTGEFRFFNTLDLGAYENPGTLSNEEFALLSNSYKIYPNPTTRGVFTITSQNNESIKLEIYDAIGKQVLEIQSITNTIDVSNLKSGMYIVKIIEGNKTQITKKLVIQN
ncbi:T9SS type A sorting domain-containing protein [uncultured Kordia sp.]|uniref:T9SS type A sorting domain-containing protein n=1 Tax=uncultured Kordia sp. TaxID=507699 RepID=UPI0026137AD1|nr:T9SS type A sorting domain-containing protein [uncultured Kordia sp.]